ncbi:hypothetical protein WL29_22425 [Burkholderia ubonensis]|uniref:Uncharacterized protein n=1 Tax=Burkholderia ubonensis TaxID=101571 RepID=A0A106QD86_9BURK|nr:hypothetical protein [Burkholderia ubonensis]KWA84123.1 hypothetical protein WL29_22425 [Burkholderia ubonensis]
MCELPEIDFDGKRVTPTNGKYKCPFRCHSSGYPAPTWKTEKGFRKHMESCPSSPSATQRKAALAAQQRQDCAQQAAAAAASLGLAVGDEVFYTSYHVTAPTHVQRGTRRVRVRYEELRSYYGAAARIESFGWVGSLVLNGSIPVGSLCETLVAAKEKAAQAQKDYQAHLDFSAAVR